MKVAIIGAGEMGRWLAKFAKKLGEVTVSDISAAKADKVASELHISAKPATEAAKQADLILIAVPISKTPIVLTNVAKIAGKGALLADVTSVKADVVDAMKKIKTDIELVSLHPLFGSGASSIKGKDIIAVPVRPGERYSELKRALSKMGAKITEMDADTHDRIMAIIQCMSHFVLLAYLRSMKSMKKLKQIDKIRTPIFSALTNLAKTVLMGNPDVQGEIQLQNKYARVVRNSMVEACRSLDVAFSTDDTRLIKRIFKESLAMFKKDDIKRAYRKLYKQFEEEIS